MLTSILQWLNSVKNHWFVAMFAFAATIALTVCVIVFATRQYRSTSRLLLRIGHESATLDPTATVTGEQSTALRTREDEVETAIGVMHSRSIMEDVVDELGSDLILSEEPAKQNPADKPDEEPGMISKITGPIKAQLRNIDPVSDREMAIRALEQGFDISAPSKSSLVSIQYRAKHPAVARDIVNAWVHSYLSHHAKVNRTQGTYKFFSEQDSELKQLLNAAHQAVREVKTRAGVATLAGQQKLLESQLESVRTELLKVDADLAESESRIESLRSMLASSIAETTTEETTGIANETHNEMRNSLFQLEVIEREYAAKYKDSHPKLLAIREQLENAREIVDSQDVERKETRQVANPIHQQILETRLLDVANNKALGQKKIALTAQHHELIAEVEALNNYEEELAKLTRDVDVLEERYRKHTVMLEQARLNEVLEERRITSINVVQAASLEERPVSPDKKLTAMVGLFAALAISLSLPVLLDARKLFFSSPPQAMATFDQPINEDNSQDARKTLHAVDPELVATERIAELATTSSLHSARPR